MKIDPEAMTGLLGPWPIYAERNRQEKSNVLLFPQVTEARCDKAVECRERLGGLVLYHHRAAARAATRRWEQAKAAMGKWP